MSNKQFTVVHLSVATGKTETRTIHADSFYVEQGQVLFIDNDNKAVAAFQAERVDSIMTAAAQGKSDA